MPCVPNVETNASLCRYETLSHILKSKCSKPSKQHSIRDEIEDCDLQWAIALRKTGDSEAVQAAAQILSQLHQSMKRRLPRWHNRLLALEKELEVNVAAHFQVFHYSE